MDSQPAISLDWSEFFDLALEAEQAGEDVHFAAKRDCDPCTPH
jgi:hypothetical protein